MDNSTIAPPPVVLPETRKNSRIGIASFAIGFLVSLFLLFLICQAVYMLSESFQEYDMFPPILSLLGVLISMILSLVGVSLGIGALVQKKHEKLYGQFGLVLNILFILFLACDILSGNGYLLNFLVYVF